METSPRLSQPLTPKGNAPLVTIDDACRYIAALPDEVAQIKAWGDAESLVLAARYGTPTESALMEVTKRLELALFVSFRLTLGWRRAAERPPAHMESGRQPRVSSRPRGAHMPDAMSPAPDPDRAGGRTPHFAVEKAGCALDSESRPAATFDVQHAARLM